MRAVLCHVASEGTCNRATITSTRTRYISAVVVLLRSAQTRQTNTQQQQQCKEHASISTPVAPSSSRQRYPRVADTRCTLLSCFVQPEIRHPSHLSFCRSYVLLEQPHVACTSMHVATQPDTFEVRTVITSSSTRLKSSRLCSLP